MANTTVHKIMAQGRRLFPLNDFGNGQWFRDKSRINFRENSQSPAGCDLTLASDYPRTFTEGRRRPGWITEEANIWLYRELVEAETEPIFVNTTNPVFACDHGVLAGDGFVTLSPAVQEAANYGKVNEHILNPVMITGEMSIEKSALDKYWETKEIDFAVSLAPGIPISCDENGGQVYLHYLNYLFNTSALYSPMTLLDAHITEPLNLMMPPASLLLLFSTVLVQSGFPRAKLSSPLYLSVGELQKIREELKNAGNKLPGPEIETAAFVVEGFCLMDGMNAAPVFYSEFDNPLPSCSVDTERMSKLNHKIATDYYFRFITMLNLD